MIHSEGLVSFAPHGRSFSHVHPSTATENEQEDAMASDGPIKECWKFTTCDTPNIEEEVYACGCTVIWSRGFHDHKTIVKCLTVNSDVKNIIWCNFGELSLKESIVNQAPERSLCIVQEELIDIFTEGGVVNSTGLPFQISNVLSIPGGLLLQRNVPQPEVNQQKSKKIPTVFSLLSPLHEPRPVVLKYGEKSSYISDPTMHILFTNGDPPIFLIYDMAVGHHSICVIRDARKEDCPEPSNTSGDFPTQYIGPISHHRTPVLSTGTHSRLSVAPSPSSVHHSAVHTPSPSSKVSRYVQSPYNLSSPVPRWPHSSRAHLQSPSQHSLGDSSFIAGLQSPDIFRSPATVTGSVHEETFWEFVEPLVPEVCLEHIWEETTTTRHGYKGEASKAFLATDICGENYVCYLIPGLSKLRFVKFIRGDRAGHYIFGVTFDISATDAVPIKDLNMVLVLTPDSTLVLYSGKIKGCEINLVGLKNISESDVKESSRVSESSLMDISSEVMILSPIPEERPSHVQQDGQAHYSRTSSLTRDGISKKFCVTGLRDPVGSDVILVLSDGQMYRMTLPLLTEDNTVSLCLNSLKQVLPNEVALKAIFKFYLLRNGQTGDTMDAWEDFSEALYKLLGCNLSEGASFDESFSSIPAKKCKTHSDEGEECWQFLLDCDYTRAMAAFGSCGLRLPERQAALPPGEEKSEQAHHVTWDPSALLHQYLPSVVFALHLVHEDFKLNRLTWRSAEKLAEILVKLTRAIGWNMYVSYYLKEYPQFSQSLGPEAEIDVRASSLQEDAAQVNKMLFPSFFTKEPPSIYHWLSECLQGNQISGFPLIPDVCQHTYNIIMMYLLCIPRHDGTHNDDPDSFFRKLSNSDKTPLFDTESEQCRRCRSPADKMVLFMAQNGFTKDDLETLPFGVSLPIREAIHFCCSKPSSHLPHDSYILIGREELAAQTKFEQEDFETLCSAKQTTEGEEVDDGMHFDCEVTTLRFSKDLRIQEVRRLLQSAKPVQVSLVQKPEVSDHDFIQEQEARLLLLCKRNLSLSVGRGMFTLATSRPTLTELVPIPPLEITGRALPRNTVISLDHVDVPTDMLVWPAFHNGVAAALRIIPGISQVDSTWIVYHRPKDNQLTNEHAGFLMGLGLTGHLANLAIMNVHNYLCKGHELTSIGLLLGLAATKRATMDLQTTKMLSIHVDALLPPTSAELDVPVSVMSAAVLGVGLVYQGTGHRLMSEVLLSEIGRPPGPEMDNAHNRECYSLCAGLALGLVMLEHGRQTFGVSELNISDHLYHYMVGGHKKPQTGTQKEKFKSPSYLIKEGDNVNTNVTAPGAILALGLIYLKSNNETVASWLSAPETPVLAEFIRPDFLLLRILCRGLIMWDQVHPSQGWVEENIPKVVQQYAFQDTSQEQNNNSDIDVPTISQTYVNIIAGCCLAMGLKFAGSANQRAFTTLMHYTKHFKDLIKKPEAEQAGKVTLEQCLNTSLLALAVVMAGTGNLDVLRIARNLHKRHGPDVTYGNHMAIHMAIGLLFLGGGRSTLSTSGPAIAALLCALFPQFPTTSSDNRCHLQALRHLYVLAVEPRLLIPRDVDTKVACYVPVEITLKKTDSYPETVMKKIAPCMLPDVDLIKQITISGQRYWSIVFDGDDVAEQLRTLLSKGGTLFVKKRIGQLPYEQDPKGYCNLLARTFTGQTEKVEVIRSFSSDPKLILLTELFCQSTSLTSKEKKSSGFLSSVLLKCVSEETTPVMPVYIAMEQAVHKVEEKQDVKELRELTVALTFYRYVHDRIREKNPGWKRLISAEYITKVTSRLDHYFDSYLETAKDEVSAHLSNSAGNWVSLKLACYLAYQGLSEASKLPADLALQNVTMDSLLTKSQELQIPLSKIVQLSIQH